MIEGLSKSEILEKIKILPAGSFRLKMAEAGIEKIGERPNKKLPHILENLYPLDAADRLLAYLKGGSL